MDYHGEKELHNGTKNIKIKGDGYTLRARQNVRISTQTG